MPPVPIQNKLQGLTEASWREILLQDCYTRGVVEGLDIRARILSASPAISPRFHDIGPTHVACGHIHGTLSPMDLLPKLLDSCAD